MIKFSLIIATLNRPAILEKCLCNIEMQKYKDFEAVIIDQSDGDETQHLLDNRHFSFVIKYIRIIEKGLSNARNIGIKSAEGDYVCLFDDDGDYDCDYLEEAYKIIQRKNDKSIISGAIWDNIENRAFVKYSKLPQKKDLSIRQIIRYCPSAALVFPKKLYDEIGLFDILFGAGAFFGAAEETDFLLRAREIGYKVYFCEELKLKHPILFEGANNDAMTHEKAKSYSRGIGALYKKHMVINGKWLMLPIFIDRLMRLGVKGIVSNSSVREIIRCQLIGTYEGFSMYDKKVQ